MGEPLYDKSGNQVFGGRGRKSAWFRDLEAQKELYRKEGETLVNIFGEGPNPEEVRKEINNYLQESRQQQARDNCRTCKSWTIPVENWPNTRRGKCTRFDTDAKSSDKCDYFARPDQESEAEWWSNLSKKEKDAILDEHKTKRDLLKDVLTQLQKVDEKINYDHELKQVYKHDINLVGIKTKAFSRKLTRLQAVEQHGGTKQYSEWLKKTSEAKRVLLFKQAAEKWEHLGVKAGKKSGQPALRYEDTTKRTVAGMAAHLKTKGHDVEVVFEQGVGFKVSR
jgi:hypothetical protein